jgi:hypothetical protein
MTGPDHEVYDRRVDNEFLKLFLRGGVLHGLARLGGRDAGFPLDLQFRKDPKNPSKQWATLYVGLTGVLYVYRTKDGVRLDAHNTWSGKASKRSPYGFDKAWLKSMSLDEVAKQAEAIDLYLEKVIPQAVRSHGLTEGAVQSVVSKAKSDEWAILDREVLPSYPDTGTKTASMRECMAPLLAATREAGRSAGALKLPQPPSSFGAECDLLAVDAQGRVLAIEVKPMAAGTIAWVPAQAAMYGRILRRWIDTDPDACDVLNGMLEQRQALGHAPSFQAALPAKPRVVPVVVLQRGASLKSLAQMHAVRAHVDRYSELPPVEIFEVSVLGDFKRLTGA